MCLINRSLIVTWSPELPLLKWLTDTWLSSFTKQHPELSIDCLEMPESLGDQ